MQADSAPKQTVSNGENAFTDGQFDAAWADFMTRHPEERLAVNTMRSSHPVRLDANTYEMTVFSESQMQIMSAVMPAVLKELRAVLKNDRLLVAIRLEIGESSPTTWNEREVLAHIIEHNPAMQTYIDTLGLTLI